MNLYEAQRELRRGVKAYLAKNYDGEFLIPEEERRPFYLVGLPGIGIPEMVQEVAKRLDIGFAHVSIMSASESAGISEFEELKKLSQSDEEKLAQAQEKMQEIKEEVARAFDNGEMEGVLLLDNFSFCDSVLEKQLRDFLETRWIGEYKLPEGWIMVLNSSLLFNDSIYHLVDESFINYVRLLDIPREPKEILDKLVIKHKAVYNYLLDHPNYIYDYQKNGMCSCQDWVRLSQTMKVYEMLEMHITSYLVSQFIKSEDIVREIMEVYTLENEKEMRDLALGVYCNSDMVKIIDKVKTNTTFFKECLMVELEQVLLENAQYYLNVNESLKKMGELAIEFKEHPTQDYYSTLHQWTQEQIVVQYPDEEKVVTYSGPDEDTRTHCSIVLRLMREEKKRCDVDKIINDEAISDSYDNEMVLESLLNYIEHLKENLKIQEKKFIQGFAFSVFFFRRIDDKNDELLKRYMEDISDEQEFLDTIFLCKNNLYGKYIDQQTDMFSKMDMQEEEDE